MDVIGTDRRPVVVGVDTSDPARDAANWAADLAAVWAAPLQLVHVGGAAGEAPPWLTELRDTAEWAGAAVSLVEVTPGEPVDVLAARSAGARLLVLGSHGLGATSGMPAGTTALDLVARAACPVAVVRGSAEGMPPPRSGPVVAGVDGSAAGHAALVLAARYAEALGARLVAVHTWTEAGPDQDAGHQEGGRQRRDEMSLADEAAHLLNGELDAVVDAHPGLQVERVLITDTPLRGLLDRAGGARMLVVGHRGHREVDGMPAGSTSSGLVEGAPCPVVAVKAAAVGGSAGGGAAAGRATS